MSTNELLLLNMQFSASKYSFIDLALVYNHTEKRMNEPRHVHYTSNVLMPLYSWS